MSFEYGQTINQRVQLTRSWIAIATQQSTQLPAADNLRVTYARVDASILHVPSDWAFVGPDTQAAAECVLATDQIMQISGVQLGTNAQDIRAVTRAVSPAHGTIQLPIFGCAFCRARGNAAEKAVAAVHSRGTIQTTFCSCTSHCYIETAVSPLYCMAE